MTTSDLLTALLAKKGADYFTEFSAFMTALLADNTNLLSQALGTTTSTTSVAVGTGAKTFTLVADRPYGVGAFVTVARTSAPSTWMFGQVTAKTGADLTVSVSASSGSGTYTDWTITAAGAIGPTGPTGADGLMVAASNAETAAGSLTTKSVTPASGKATYLAQGKHTIWIPAGAMVSRSTNGAASGTAETTTNRVMRKSLDFDPATNQYAQFWVGMPKSWDLSTVTAEFIWTAASGSGAVVWGLQGRAVSDGDATDTAFGTAQEVTDTLVTAGGSHTTTATAAVTISNSPAALDSVVFQVYRNAASGSDTLAVNASLLGVRITYGVSASNDA